MDIKLNFRIEYLCYNFQGGRGHWTVNYIWIQRCIITLYYSLALKDFGYFWWIMIYWFYTNSVQTFQPITKIYRWDYFIYHHWRCLSIYCPLSYPSKSLSESRQSWGLIFQPPGHLLFNKEPGLLRDWKIEINPQ